MVNFKLKFSIFDYGSNKENQDVRCEPLRPHLTLTKYDIFNRPVIVVGDVHGCLEELKEFVTQVQKKHPRCVFLFCGDLVNKGPYSLETLRYIRSLGWRARSIRGNHECNIIKLWLAWKANSNITIKTKFQWLTGLNNEDIKWMREMPYTISIPHLNSVIVHAGLVAGIPLEHQDPWNMTEMIDIVVSQSGVAKVTDQMNGTPWGELWKGPQHVYFGHASQRGLQFYPYATGLDTGCVVGKQLTGKYLTGDKGLVQVQAKQVYREKKNS